MKVTEKCEMCGQWCDRETIADALKITGSALCTICLCEREAAPGDMVSAHWDY